MKSAVEHLNEELKKVRTGRAHPSVLDSVQVEAYGQMVPLKQVANVTAPEAQLLQITPFDPNTIQAIAASIRNDQSLGLNPSDDGHIIRVPMPPLTEERRRQIAKSLGDTVEETRVVLRNIRHDALKEAKRAKDAKEATEDDYKRTETQLNDMVNTFQKEIEDAQKAKEEEIMTV